MAHLHTLMARVLCLLMVGAALGTGCATVEGREQIVSLDSAPRGAVITRRGDGVVVGVTPVLIAQPRAEQQSYGLRFADGTTAAVDAACVPRGGFVAADAIAALPLLVLPVIGGAAFVAVAGLGAGVDTIDGAVFACPTVMAAPPGPVPSPPAAPDDVVAEAALASLPVFVAEGCPRFLIAPPAAGSDVASRALLASAGASLQALVPCATVVDAVDAVDVFARRNVSFERPLLRERFTRDAVYDVAHATQATHLVVIEPAEGALTAGLRVVDVHTLQASSAPPLALAPPPPEPDFDLGRSTWSLLANALPDTFVWNIAAKAFLFESTRGEDVVVNEFVYPLLATSINFQLYHLDHPEVHNPYDVQLSIAPDFLFLLNGSRLVLQDPDGARRTVTLTVIQAVAPVVPRATFFTPAGVTSVWVGVGPGLVVDWDEPAYDFAARVGLFGHGGVSHSIFLTRTFFIGVAGHANRSAWSHVDRNGVKLDWFFQSSVNLGFSFPDVGDDVRGWL